MDLTVRGYSVCGVVWYSTLSISNNLLQFDVFVPAKNVFYVSAPKYGQLPGSQLSPQLPGVVPEYKPSAWPYGLPLMDTMHPPRTWVATFAVWWRVIELWTDHWMECCAIPFNSVDWQLAWWTDSWLGGLTVDLVDWQLTWWTDSWLGGLTVDLVDWQLTWWTIWRYWWKETRSLPVFYSVYRGFPTRMVYLYNDT